MASGRLVDYLGKGLAADRPVSLSLHPDAIGLYYAEDTSVMSAWDGTVWTTVASAGDVVGPVSSVNNNVALFDGVTGKLLKDGGALGTAAFTASTDYATAAQGALADSAIQPADLATVATTGDVDDLVGFPGGTTDFLRADGTFAVPTGAVSTVNGNTGAVVLDDGDVKSVVTALTSGTTVTVDCSLGRNFTITLGHNVGTLTLSNLAGSGYATEIEIEIKQDATGGRTFALPASFKALGGSDTAIASAANAVTVLSAKTFDNGTTWRYAMQESA